ncbi:hypothetical protein KKJ06_19175 [Xenorhabdus bovienii]|uniref:hypothetical protein n=1 Tax=Xenorhabdus bovienii TaxID=40576 RepID=UPI0023B354E1|nr:hypothetical protein [Xenorhabdus bovienii]MDE9483411.1 hypothetical protein [Xenorhabdus bovienii]MDE9557488.1 hypothetical protein [Xenorhabdus bovienii]
MPNLKDLSNQLALIRKQIPFAMAQALTSVARDGVWQRKKSKSKKSKRRRFGDALPVEPILGYQERAQQMAQSLMPAAISQALSEAIQTAK